MTNPTIKRRANGIPPRLLTMAGFLAAFGSAHAQSAPSAMRIEQEEVVTEVRNKEVVRQAFETWRAGGNVFETLLVPDVVWTIHGSGPVAGTYRGLQNFIQNASVPLVSRLTTPILPDVRSIMADGDIVSIRFDGSATTTSGAPYRNQFVWIFRMVDGRVVEAEAFLDLVAYQQVVENNQPRAR
ncbi:nuclear transport factor 2 family protein [Bosea sp. (in: a-proteobacteria)]|uniref:nuclear transport factor 2 family protein n=1 Tax=Bosea sp. (in: a-proteobacteria) TaxID=1871050 RepID=UPI002B494645|nr:nuclear transport factor 2 family protein [Bosea sp. (in: a-proteobacteria)]WRH56718.1 MAG: nuclear transport factor 2 family protein [Bosea sp. (in: a-proteobacteria)]